LVLDTQQGRIIKLLSLADAKSLVWSPDGEQIAMIARYQPSSYNEDVISIRADDGEIVYSASIDFGSGKSANWPPLNWGTQFPVQMGGLSSCAAAPK
jgi:hypothetical protein